MTTHTLPADRSPEDLAELLEHLEQIERFLLRAGMHHPLCPGDADDDVYRARMALIAYTRDNEMLSETARRLAGQLGEAEQYIAQLRAPMLYHFGTADPELLAEVWDDQASARAPEASLAETTAERAEAIKWLLYEIGDALTAYGNAEFDCGDFDDEDDERYDPLLHAVRDAKHALLVAIDARIQRIERERDAAVAATNEMRAAIVAAHSDLQRYAAHDEECEKTPRTIRGVVYGEALPPRPCTCGLDDAIEAAQSAIDIDAAAAPARTGEAGRE